MGAWSWLGRWSDRVRRDDGIAADTRHAGPRDAPRVLILSASKRNQNWYRDQEIARQTQAVLLTERFDFSSSGHDVANVCDLYFGGEPDLVFLNYTAAYTPRLTGFNRLRCPLFAFVGDHYDFTDTGPKAREKQAFFRDLPIAAMVTAYPHTNAVVCAALGRPRLPFIHLPWAVDPDVFRDLGRRRPYDIACLGALTESKYPLRRTVRAWLERQSGLKLFRKRRVKGRGGADHDGEAFNRALNRSRSAFTCASTFGYTLMKYFEIPAAGCLLFAEQTADLAGLGFQDQDNYVRVTAADFADRFRHYLIGPGRQDGERIRVAGMALVRSRHTWNRRVADLLAAFDRYRGLPS